MPRIVRKNQKIFAEDASNNGVFGSLQSNNPVTSSDPDVLQSRTAFSNGWNDATYSSELLPPLEEFQGLQYLFSRQLAYIFQEGISEWNTDTVYFKGSVVKAIDDTEIKIYVSLTDNNSGNLVTDTTKWKMVFDSSAPYADYNFSNLSSVAKNIANWSTNVSNCFTQIPQDIKLELDTATGYLTIKAGSKLYRPNGAGNFDVVTLATDMVRDAAFSAASTQTMLFTNGTTIFQSAPSLNSSGTTIPTNGTFYNTSTNTIKHYAGGSVIVDNVFFPLAIITTNASGFTASIDRVFNGFGYIGSTGYSLPGIKGLIPNGRNADGTAKNIALETTQVSIRTWDHQSSVQPLCIDDTGMLYSVALYFEYDYEPVSPTTNFVLWYNPKENILRYSSNDNVWHIVNNWLYTGIITSSADSANNYRISRFEQNKSVFQALDMNNKEVLCGSMIPAPERAVQISLPYTTKEDCYIAFKQQGESGSSQEGNGILVDGVYGFAATNGVWGQYYYPVMYGGLYVGKGKTVQKTSSRGTYTVYFIPLKGMIK